jgi:hypothetical protein
MNKRSKKCKKLLSNKIKTNTREFKKKSILRNGRKFKSRSQAIAVSYSQIKKTNPKCFR